MIRYLLRFAIASSLLLATSPVAQAQSASNAFKGMGNNDEPIQIEADRMEIIGTQNAALFVGNVNVAQGETILSAGKLTVSYQSENTNSNTPHGIEKIIASDTVAVRSGNDHVTASRADIDLVREYVTLSGNVKMSRGQDIAAGCVVKIDLKNEVTKIESCDTGELAESGNNRRPIVIFTPKSRNVQ